MTLLLTILLTLFIMAFILGSIILIIYYFAEYKNNLEGHNEDKIYMTWREYRKFSKIFPKRYFIGHYNPYNYYHSCKWEQLFFVDTKYKNKTHLMPIKFHFFTGYIPWVFYLLIRKLLKLTNAQKQVQKKLNEAKSIMLNTLQADVEKELKKAQKEIDKAKEMNEQLLGGN